jgi:SNF2 family DNA or RNA helicase
LCFQKRIFFFCFFQNKVAKAEVVVTTYDFIRDHQKRKSIEKWGKLPHLRKLKWHVIVVDEAHHINNNTSQISKSLRQFDCIRKFLLTGTPLQNTLQDLWALLNYLMPQGNVFCFQASFICVLKYFPAKQNKKNSV